MTVDPAHRITRILNGVIADLTDVRVPEAVSSENPATEALIVMQLNEVSWLANHLAEGIQAAWEKQRHEV